jgi:hypothetical protein
MTVILTFKGEYEVWGVGRGLRGGGMMSGANTCIVEAWL